MDNQAYLRQLEVNGEQVDYFNIRLLEENGVADIKRLPLSIRILVENLLRKMDGRIVMEEKILIK